MTDLNTFSPAARSAAMRGGTDGWAQVGGLPGHIRYMELRPRRPGRKPKCNCGCGTPKTHLGKANGVCLTSGCEMYVRRWTKSRQEYIRTPPAKPVTPPPSKSAAIAARTSVPMEKKKLGPDHFRYVDDIGPDGLEIQCVTYQVIGETAQCWYIADDYTVNMINGYQHSWTAEAVKKRRKRVSKDPGGKRFAYPDKAHALRSYKIRKQRQLGHAELTLERARAALGYFGDLSVNDIPASDKLTIPNEHIQGLGWGYC